MIVIFSCSWALSIVHWASSTINNFIQLWICELKSRQSNLCEMKILQMLKMKNDWNELCVCVFFPAPMPSRCSLSNWIALNKWYLVVWPLTRIEIEIEMNDNNFLIQIIAKLSNNHKKIYTRCCKNMHFIKYMYTGKRNIYIFVRVFVCIFELNILMSIFRCCYAWMCAFILLCFCRAFSLFIIMAQPVCQWKSSHHTIQNFRTTHVFRFGSLLSVIMDRTIYSEGNKMIWHQIHMEFIYLGSVNGERWMVKTILHEIKLDVCIEHQLSLVLSTFTKWLG